MPTRYKSPPVEERSGFASAKQIITDLANKIHEWQLDASEGMRLAVTMRTPDGQRMLVRTVYPSGESTFVAEGVIDKLRCMVTGHISTLTLCCLYVLIRGRDGQVNFVIKTDPPDAAQPAAKPKPKRTSRAR